MLQQVCWPAAPLGSHAGMPRMPHPTAASSTGTEGRGTQQPGHVPMPWVHGPAWQQWELAAWRDKGPWGTATCMHASPSPVHLWLSVHMGLHKWPCPRTSTHTHPHVHAFTHVCLPACAFAHLCVHTHVCIHSHVHITCMDTFTHMCVHLHVQSLTLVLVLPGMGLCSSLCTHMHVDAFTHVRACVHLCALTCVCLYPPHAAVCLHSACFQPTIYMIPCMRMCLLRCVLAYIHTHHPCAHVLTCMRMGSPASILPRFRANVRVHTLPHMCMHPPMRAHAHSHVRVLTHTCTHAPTGGRAHASTPVCVCSHACACATQRPALPLHRGSPSPARGRGAARGAQGACAALARREGAKPRSVVPGWHAEALGQAFGQQGNDGHARVHHPAVLG